MKLKELKRFVVRQGKIPIGKWQDSSNWLSYESALQKSKTIKDGGVSIVLGKINEEYTLAGIDLDTIQDKTKNIIDYEIKKDIEPFKHKHDSLSGYGIHILCLVKNDLKLDKGKKKHIVSKLKINRLDESGNLKIPEIEFYINNKVFALPIALDTDSDDIINSTKDYINLYNKYFGNTIKSQSNSQSESEKDFAFFIELIEKGYENREEMKNAYWQSELFAKKDQAHKEKGFRQDYLNITIDNALKGFGQQKAKEKPKIDNILELIKDKEIFIDERDIAYIIINYQNIKIDSKKFEQYLTYECYENNIKFNQQMINSAISYINYMAIKNNNRHTLNVRFAEDDNYIYYQLSEEDIVKISSNGYEIVKNDFPLFKWVNMLPQVKPQKSNVEFKYLLSKFNIDEEQKVLFIMYLVSLFIPNIPKPILILSAEKGAGKTTTTKFIKSLVDPSILDTTRFPKDISSLSQIFDHSALICFDNLDKLQNWQSDALCRAYSGEAISKRKLYTDEEDVVCQYKRAIILNGINCPATREDILDRAILINLKRFKQYKAEQVIYEEWETLKPQFLDLIFRTISKALPLHYSINIEELGRTADWCKWCYSIAETIQRGLGKKFLEDYKQNISNQNNEVVESNILVQAVLSFMENRLKWEGLATELFNELKTYAIIFGLDGFPKNSSWLTRDLKRFLSVLESQNIMFSIKATNKGSRIELSKTR
ncbi:MAG: hypothetical protein PHU94_03515 [Bacilli bacterium]|nr:hypothetical protein [Bacilli bacterium]MDD4718602.1 hypothetical protein [Bacilli bacterium]